MINYADMNTSDRRRAIALVYKSTGVHMEETKQALLQSRLRVRMREVQLVQYHQYLDLVEADRDELERFIDIVTTHQTQFFRTPRIWRYLSEDFLPEWAKRHPSKNLYAWSAAASTGEECCSLAMALEEWRQDEARKANVHDYRVLGTDISAAALQQATSCHYRGTSARQLRQDWPTRFYRFNSLGEDACFELLPSIRQRMQFQRASLMDPAPSFLEKFDLVLLRNVMIYFSEGDCAAVVNRVAEAMKNGGLLVIGESESLTSVDSKFEFVQPQVYRLQL